MFTDYSNNFKKILSELVSIIFEHFIYESLAVGSSELKTIKFLLSLTPLWFATTLSFCARKAI